MIATNNSPAPATGRALSALLPAAMIVLIMDVLGVPLLILNEDKGFNDPTVIHAYVATLIACAILGVGYKVLGIHRDLMEYQTRPLEPWPLSRYETLWRGTLVANLIGIAILWWQAEFRIPAQESIGVDFATYALLRSKYDRQINQSLFSFVLYLLATPNVIIAWLYMPKRWVPKIASLLLVVATGAFTLARSPLGLAGVFVLNYALLTRSISKRLAVLGSAGSVAAILAAHAIAGGTRSYEVHGSIGDYLWMRVIYGEWMGLPAFSTSSRTPGSRRCRSSIRASRACWASRWTVLRASS